MQVSGRARLAWANRNIEAAADIIVAEEFRVIARQLSAGLIPTDSEDLALAFLETADELDPEGDN